VLNWGLPVNQTKVSQDYFNQRYTLHAQQELPCDPDAGIYIGTDLVIGLDDRQHQDQVELGTKFLVKPFVFRRRKSITGQYTQSILLKIPSFPNTGAVN
jgi:hypothetical protein